MTTIFNSEHVVQQLNFDNVSAFREIRKCWQAGFT
jgi:hypothetical protein